MTPWTGHPLAVAAAVWTTNADTLNQAQQIGDQLDAVVAEALAEADLTTARASLWEAVRALDLLPQWFVVNMPGAAWNRYYEQQRRALHARAVVLFGLAEGQRAAPALEHEPTMTLGRSIWLR